MSKEANLAAQKRFGEAVNSGRSSELREVIATDVVDHDPASIQGPGPEAYIVVFSMMRAAFSDLAIAVEHQVAGEDNGAFGYTITGTREGDFMGIAATKRKIEVRGMQISRFENGKRVERWGSSDELGILEQPGVSPTSGG